MLFGGFLITFKLMLILVGNMVFNVVVTRVQLPAWWSRRSALFVWVCKVSDGRDENKVWI